MIKWLKYDKGSIFRDKKPRGLLSLFLKDYKNEFGGSINPSCIHCLEAYYNNFINQFVMEAKEQKCKFRLKLKYEGIKSPVTRRPIRNGDLTDEQAIELIEKHPHGKMLFDKIPQSYYKEKKAKERKQPESKPKQKRTRKAKK